MDEGDAPQPNTALVVRSVKAAYSALREAVDYQRRPDPAAGSEVWLAEVHELRSVMLAADQLIRSIDLDAFDFDKRAPSAANAVGPLKPSDETNSDEQIESTQLLDQARNDLAAARRHLGEAAASMTNARKKLAQLSGAV